MGQAKILSGGPAGLYNIELIQETTRATARLDAIKKRLEGTDGDPNTNPPKPATIGLIDAISAATAAVSVAEAALTAARNGLDASINATKEETGKGSLIAVARWYNKGNGTCTKANPGSTTRVGRYSMECISVVASPKCAIFAVTDTLGSPLPEAEAGTAYASAEINFTINFGSTDYQTGDAFDIEVASGQEIPAVKEQSASEKVVNAIKTLAGSRRVLSLLKLEQTSLLKEQTALQAAVAPVVKNDVWCADLTTNIPPGRIVGTIEVNGEASPAPPIIMPAGAAGLGRLQPPQASTPAGVFVNWALLPCWQRWKPTYRIGTITAINLAGTVCTVRLDEALSSAQDLNINATGGVVALSGVPVEYMNGANVFVVGDRVVVQLTGQAWASPKVIGFESHPRGPQPGATGAYYVFYLDGATMKVAYCSYGVTPTVVETKSYELMAMAYNNSPVRWHLKRFTHNVDGIARDLYFLATSLYIDPNPYTGWVAFAAANPTHPLVTNKLSTQITMTDRVLDDLRSVNLLINHGSAYIPDPAGNDNWHILGPEEGGDCEDFALTKAEALLSMGYAASAIHIEAGSTPEGVGHAWLVVQTTQGDYALDINSDVVGLNSALQASGEKPYGCRLRQIGRKWAAISPFAWAMRSSNAAWPAGVLDREEPSMYWYILDPLMNILHPISDSLMMMPFDRSDPGPGAEALGVPSYNGASINFSADNNLFYVASGGLIKAFTLDDNTLTLVTLDAYTGKGWVGRDGNIRVPVESGDSGTVFWPWGMAMSAGGTSSGSAIALDGIDVVSKPGYYDYAYKYRFGSRYGDGWLNFLYDFSSDTVPPSRAYYSRTPDSLSYGPDEYTVYTYLTISREFNQPSYYFEDFITNGYDLYHHTPFPFSEISAELRPAGAYSLWGYPWGFADTDSLLIQSFLFIKGIPAWTYSRFNQRIYRNGTEITAAVAAAVGVAADKVLGLVYLPNTDRLN